MQFKSKVMWHKPKSACTWLKWYSLKSEVKLIFCGVVWSSINLYYKKPGCMTDTCMQGAITLRVRFSCVLSKSQYCCAQKILHMLLCGEKFEPDWIHLVLPLLPDSVVVLFWLALAKSNLHHVFEIFVWRLRESNQVRHKHAIQLWVTQIAIIYVWNFE